MDNADKIAGKFTDKWNFQKAKCPQSLSNASGSAGARTTDHLIKSQPAQSNISNLTLKTMRINAYVSLECIRIHTNRNENNGNN